MTSNFSPQRAQWHLIKRDPFRSLLVLYVNWVVEYVSHVAGLLDNVALSEHQEIFLLTMPTLLQHVFFYYLFQFFEHCAVKCLQFY